MIYLRYKRKKFQYLHLIIFYLDNFNFFCYKTMSRKSVLFMDNTCCSKHTNPFLSSDTQDKICVCQM